MDVKFMAYQGKYSRPPEKPKKSKLLFIILSCLLLAGCVFGAYALFSDGVAPPEADITLNNVNTSPPDAPSWLDIINTEPTNMELEAENPSEPLATEPVIYTASVGAMGDLLMHSTIFDKYYSAEAYQNGEYNFDSLFKYITNDITSLDYTAINLETTLCGTNNGYKYSGYPSFNCPDEIIDGARNAGFDMVLTANNHSYDTRLIGLKRTVNTITEKGMETLGTYSTPEETKWTIQNINNINVGMLCYTYATDVADGKPSLNGNPVIQEAGLCNYFYSGNLNAFYKEVEGYLAEMEEAGMDVSIMYIHWGNEYQLTASAEQKTIAQKLCDMGIDVIVGGHPHVVQPMDLLESTVDPEHKTVCIYSTGNAVSNQRLGNLSSVKTAHTEDGVLFTVTFEKYEGGEAYVSDVIVVPTWVNMYTNSNGRREYNILPLHRNSVNSWQNDFALSSKAYTQAKDSFDRTMDIIGNGLAEITEYLSSIETTPPSAGLVELARNNSLRGGVG